MTVRGSSFLIPPSHSPPHLQPRRGCPHDGRMSGKKDLTSAAPSPGAMIDSFLDQARQLGPPADAAERPRLVFALDATMSRQPTWDLACRLQGEMFGAAAGTAGSRCSSSISAASPNAAPRACVADPRALTALMAKIDCRGGQTQIGRVLAPCARRGRTGAGARPRLCRRRHGGAGRRALRGRGRARAPRRQGLHVPRGSRSRRGGGLPRDRAADRRRLCAVRCRRRARPGGPAARRGRLCGGGRRRPDPPRARERGRRGGSSPR